MAEPTNSDIMATLGTLSERIDQHHTYNKAEFTEIKKKQDHTNGDVTALKKWRAEIEAVEKYKKSQPVINKAENVEVKSVWMTDGGQKVFLAVAGLITAIALAISYFATRGGI